MSKITEHFVDDWKRWHHWASMRLGAVASLVAGYIVSSPDVLINTLNQLPPEIRSVLPGFITIGAFVLIFLTRVWAKKKADAPAPAQAASGDDVAA